LGDELGAMRGYEHSLGEHPEFPGEHSRKDNSSKPNSQE